MPVRPPEDPKELTNEQVLGALSATERASYQEDVRHLSKARNTRELGTIPDDPDAPDQFTGEQKGIYRRFAASIQQARLRVWFVRQIAFERLWGEFWRQSCEEMVK